MIKGLGMLVPRCLRSRVMVGNSWYLLDTLKGQSRLHDMGGTIYVSCEKNISGDILHLMIWVELHAGPRPCDSTEWKSKI